MSLKRSLPAWYPQPAAALLEQGVSPEGRINFLGSQPSPMPVYVRLIQE
jgi:hypothetical protein